jgi:hypothetical protein
VLSPGLEIPHAAKDCTVYLHNLLFNHNCLANVSGPLYQNNQVALTLSGQTPINIEIGPSALASLHVTLKPAAPTYLLRGAPVGTA